MEKCISLFQPIASMVVDGIKRVETRGYPVKYRGRLWIHAAKAFPSDGFIQRYVDNPVFRFYALGGHRHTTQMALLAFRDYPRGAIVGYVDLVDCFEGKEARARLGALDYRREKAVGDLEGPERFGWLLRNAVKLDKPIPATGQQGFWDAEPWLKGSLDASTMLNLKEKW